LSWKVEKINNIKSIYFVRKINLKNQLTLKQKIIVLAFFLGFFTTAFSQSENSSDRYGLFYSHNFSSQTNFNPMIPEDGVFQWNTLSTYGIGAFYEKLIRQKFAINTQAIFQVKGYKETAQIAEINIPGSFRENDYANKFRYVTLEINPVYYFSKSKIITPFISAGLNGNYLINSDLGSDEYPINTSYPVNEYDEFRRLSMGYNLSAGIFMNNLLSLEGKFQKDLTPILNKENLQIWNWVWSINFKLNVQQILFDVKEKAK